MIVRRRSHLIVLAGLVLLVLGASRSARAAGTAASASSAATSASAVTTVSEVGWWSRRPGAAAQPPGYFEVASGVDGEESVAALRVPLAGRVTSASLELAEAGGTSQTTAVLKVCTTTAAWTSANPGAYANAPAADCNGAVNPQRDASGHWTVDVTDLLAGASGSATLMVLPVPKPVGGLIDPGFSIQFSPAVVRSEVAPTASGTSADATAATPPRPSSSAVVPAVPIRSGALPISPTGPVTVTSPPTTTATSLPSEQAAAFQVVVRSAGHGGKAKPWGRLLWLVPLSALGGLAAALARRHDFAL